MTSDNEKVNTEEIEKNDIENDFLDTNEIEIKEDPNKEEYEVKESKPLRKEKKHIIATFLSTVVLIISIGYFFISFLQGYEKPMTSLINGLLLVLFSIVYTLITITYRRNSKKMIVVANIFLILFYTFGILNTLKVIDLDSTRTMVNFYDKDLTYVVNWASKNNIEVEQVFEYSDMIDEYHVISQDIPVGLDLKSVKKVKLAISEGANPYKEIIIPNMVTWDSEQVLNYIEDNYLTNVQVEFVSSEKAVDTVIEQSVSGTVKRNDEIKLTFSYGEERDYEEVKLIDLKNMSKFRTEFYLKQHGLRYEFDEDYDNKVKQGKVKSQEISAGEMVKVDDTKVKVTISKGPKIKVPDLTKMSLNELTEWIIKNKLRLSFTDKYDDNVKENNVIEANFKKGEIIAQGTTVKIVISKGQLKMKDFSSLSEFREWAEKYGIKYEEQHEFSDKVDEGEVISYSHKKGDVIKNDDTIVVKISDGKKVKVPNLEGLTKKKITSKLDELGLKYNFVYKSSDKVDEGKAIKQSISSGSEVSKGTTITITLSSGKASSNDKKTNNDSKSNNSSSNNSSSNNNSSNTQERQETQQTTKKSSEVYVQPTWIEAGNATGTCNNLKSNICGSIGCTISCKYEDSDEGIGLISPNSQYKARNTYTFTEGQTYTFTIYK